MYAVHAILQQEEATELTGLQKLKLCYQPAGLEDPFLIKKNQNHQPAEIISSLRFCSLEFYPKQFFVCVLTNTLPQNASNVDNCILI